MADAMSEARKMLQLRSRPSRGAPPPAAAPRVQVIQDFGQPAAPAAAPAIPIVERRRVAKAGIGPAIYAVVSFLLIIAGVAAVWHWNQRFAGEMYDDEGLRPAAEAFAKGQNYAVFDLNLNIRRLRDMHVGMLAETPDVMILGASHWQEANAGLVKDMKFYNAHVHRDYWEDMLGVTEILVRHNRLPKRVIISVRDNLFTPMAARKDFLWEPGIPYWRAMAARLGIETEPVWQSLPYQRLRERVSISMLFTNLTRWYNASEHPHATTDVHFKGLDTLLPDGSIVWSADHLNIFTPERARREALAFAEKRLNSPPMVEERGVAAFEKLLDFYKDKGVTVYFVQPPFNPIYYDHVEGSPYKEGLTKIEDLTRDIARRHGITIIGGFNPHKVGCDASMYIDAEHSNARCLQKIFDEFSALERAKGGA